VIRCPAAAQMECRPEGSPSLAGARRPRPQAPPPSRRRYARAIDDGFIEEDP